MSESSVGPYEPCPCGNGAKYKFCCRDKDRESVSASANPDSGDFSKKNFMKFANELGLTEHMGPQGADEVYRLAREMEKNRKTRKTRLLPQMETQVDPKLPAAAVHLSSAYPKPEPVRTRGALLRPGDLITREWIAQIKQDPAWQDGERPEEPLRKTFLALLAGWEEHLVGALRFSREAISGWRPLLEEYIFGYLACYGGELATDIGKKAHVVRQYLGNFYPRKFMDCNLESLYQALKGMASFYVYLYHLGLIDIDKVAGVVKVCEDHEFFRCRLEGYFRAEGDEMRRWVDDWDYDGAVVENP